MFNDSTNEGLLSILLINIFTTHTYTCTISTVSDAIITPQLVARGDN